MSLPCQHIFNLFLTFHFTVQTSNISSELCLSPKLKRSLAYKKPINFCKTIQTSFSSANTFYFSLFIFSLLVSWYSWKAFVQTYSQDIRRHCQVKIPGNARRQFLLVARWLESGNRTNAGRNSFSWTGKGTYINDVRRFSTLFDPPSPPNPILSHFSSCPYYMTSFSDRWTPPPYWFI